MTLPTPLCRAVLARVNVALARLPHAGGAADAIGYRFQGRAFAWPAAAVLPEDWHTLDGDSDDMVAACLRAMERAARTLAAAVAASAADDSPRAAAAAMLAFSPELSASAVDAPVPFVAVRAMKEVHRVRHHVHRFGPRSPMGGGRLAMSGSGVPPLRCSQCLRARMLTRPADGRAAGGLAGGRRWREGAVRRVARGSGRVCCAAR